MKYKKLKELLEYEQPTRYIVGSTNYSDKYDIPVLTAGQSFILGYTNEKENIFPKSKLPVIIFDDFTTASKFVDFPFKVKSSAMKILHIVGNTNIKYVFYAMKTLKFDSSMHKRYWISAYSNLEIPIQDIQTQYNIVNKLDKVQKLIDLNQEQIELLDELIKSKFIEMFGNPNINEKHWIEKMVIDECECMVPGRDKPKSFTGNIPWITIEDLNVNGVTFESKLKVGLTQEEISQVKRKKIPKGSVIMSCVGNLGICSIAGKEMVINQQLHSFQCKENINNVYLMYYLSEKKEYMNKNASSTTVLYMNKTICNSIPLLVPPIELQNQFAEIVTKQNKQKEVYQKNLEEAQELMNTLMNQYFN